METAEAGGGGQAGGPMGGDPGVLHRQKPIRKADGTREEFIS